MSKEINVVFTRWDRLNCKDNTVLELTGILQQDENGKDFIQVDLDGVQGDNDVILIKL